MTKTIALLSIAATLLPLAAQADPATCPGATATVSALNASNTADKAYLTYSNDAITHADRVKLCSAEYFSLWDAAIAARAALQSQAQTARATCTHPTLAKNLDDLLAPMPAALAKQRSDIAAARKTCGR